MAEAHQVGCNHHNSPAHTLAAIHKSTYSVCKHGDWDVETVSSGMGTHVLQHCSRALR